MNRILLGVLLAAPLCSLGQKFPNFPISGRSTVPLGPPSGFNPTGRPGLLQDREDKDANFQELAKNKGLRISQREEPAKLKIPRGGSSRKKGSSSASSSSPSRGSTRFGGGAALSLNRSPSNSRRGSRPASSAQSSSGLGSVSRNPIRRPTQGPETPAPTVDSSLRSPARVRNRGRNSEEKQTARGATADARNRDTVSSRRRIPEAGRTEAAGQPVSSRGQAEANRGQFETRGQFDTRDESSRGQFEARDQPNRGQFEARDQPSRGQFEIRDQPSRGQFEAREQFETRDQLSRGQFEAREQFETRDQLSRGQFEAREQFETRDQLSRGQFEARDQLPRGQFDSRDQLSRSQFEARDQISDFRQQSEDEVRNRFRNRDEPVRPATESRKRLTLAESFNPVVDRSRPQALRSGNSIDGDIRSKTRPDSAVTEATSPPPATLSAFLPTMPPKTKPRSRLRNRIKPARGQAQEEAADGQDALRGQGGIRGQGTSRDQETFRSQGISAANEISRNQADDAIGQDVSRSRDKSRGQDSFRGQQATRSQAGNPTDQEVTPRGQGAPRGQTPLRSQVLPRTQEVSSVEAETKAPNQLRARGQTPVQSKNVPSPVVRIENDLEEDRVTKTKGAQTVFQSFPATFIPTDAVPLLENNFATDIQDVREKGPVVFVPEDIALQQAQLTWQQDPFRSVVSDLGKPVFDIDFSKNPALRNAFAGEELPRASIQSTKKVEEARPLPAFVQNRGRQQVDKEEKTTPSKVNPSSPSIFNPSPTVFRPELLNGKNTDRSSAENNDRQIGRQPLLANGQTVRQQQQQSISLPQQEPAAVVNAAPTAKPSILDTVTWTPTILRQDFQPQDLQQPQPPSALGTDFFPGFPENNFPGFSDRSSANTGFAPNSFTGFSRPLPSAPQPRTAAASPNFGGFSVFNSELFGDSSATSPRFTKSVQPPRSSGSGVVNAGSGSTSFVSLFSPNFSYSSNL